MNDRKKIIASITCVSLALLLVYAGHSAFADDTIVSRVKGKIVLQVEDHGEAWYVNPVNLKKYYLGRPSDAFDLMKKLGLGITNQDLAKIPVGLIADTNKDSDSDGLNDDLEKALGTDLADTDTDNDGFDDRTEITNGYDPLPGGTQKADRNFSSLNAGKIFLQVEAAGAAWYVNPADLKRYYLNRPADAFSAMRTLGLGIKTEDLAKIDTYYDPAEAIEEQESPETPANKDYQNNDFNYTLSYPSTWQLKTFSSAPAMIQLTDALVDYASEHRGVIAVSYFKTDKQIENVDNFRIASKAPSKTLTDEAKTLAGKDAYENSYEHQLAYEKTTTIKVGGQEVAVITLATTNDRKDYYEKIYDEVVAGLKFGQ